MEQVRMAKDYDYLLKVLLVGDSDVGKHEIISGLEDGSSESPFCSGSGEFPGAARLSPRHWTSSHSIAFAAYKTTTILLDGKRVKLQLWETSGQGRFSTIIRSYSRGAQGIILVYDITNKWSFDGIGRWLKEVEEHAPGVPKVLVGNRLHLAFKRQVAAKQAELYASRHKMACFEISPLCDFNIRESFCELARMALHRNGMERIWRSNKVLSLQELCCRTIVRRTSVYAIDTLPLPPTVKSHLKSYALTSSQCINTLTNNSKNRRVKTPTQTNSTRNSCCIS
ncbi:ras-related protein Rab-40B isoform X1 [Phlebotomus argentipes]|uniref:ras-related protein Rab-40B isoform X1 n=1 Tax=Phlebotomus argentipes TaxID=94469 RepID=UPI0028929A51|nr:ras-related protein Rab-40B isoform X1 [Phlebotomus argentipes]